MLSIRMYDDEDIGEYIKITHSSINYKDIWEEVTIRIPISEFEKELKIAKEDYEIRSPRK